MEYPGLWTEHGLDSRTLSQLWGPAPSLCRVGDCRAPHSHTMMGRAALCRDRVVSPSHRPSRRSRVCPGPSARAVHCLREAWGSRAFRREPVAAPVVHGEDDVPS